MNIHDDCASLYAYTRWADERILAVARQLSPEQFVQEPVPGWASVRSSLVHMGGAMLAWSQRLHGDFQSPRATEEEYPTIDDVARLLTRGHDAMDEFVKAQTPESLATIWEANDPRGLLRRLPYWAVYRHVVNHQTYHRGQVVSKLKRLGIEAPSTDLIYWALEHTPQPSVA